jgi:pimeloyl-[acyl-carrier protein] methyl ester esterase
MPVECMDIAGQPRERQVEVRSIIAVDDAGMEINFKNRRVLILLSVLASAHCLSGATTALDRPRVQVHGRFRVECRGSGRDVLLIPGLGASASLWDETVRQLGPKLTTHAIHIAGFGGEPARENAKGEVLAGTARAMAQYISDKRLVRPLVVGHSAGGIVALRLALERPDLVEALMVVDALPFPAALEHGAAATVLSVGVKAREAFAETLAMSPGQRAAALQSDAANSVIDLDAAYRVAQWGVRSDRDVLARATLELDTTDLRPRMASLSKPLTVVFADHASLGAPPGWAHGIFSSQYSEVPKVLLILKEARGSRHFVMFDQPAVFFEALAAFITHR